MAKVNGFKVFNEDWTCRNKTYECPGKFEEDIKLAGRYKDEAENIIHV